MKKVFLCLFLFLSALSTVHAQEAVDYLHVGDMLKFNKQKYYLGWSTKVSENKYLQEYFPKGEEPDSFVNMLSVWVNFERPIDPQYSVWLKEQELDQRKEKDGCCHYLAYENDGKFMLDFMVSEGPGDGTLSVMESNLHFYQKVEIDGRDALLLIFYSRRAYGDDIIPYLSMVRDSDTRTKWIEAMAKMQVNCSLK